MATFQRDIGTRGSGFQARQPLSLRDWALLEREDQEVETTIPISPPRSILPDRRYGMVYPSHATPDVNKAPGFRQRRPRRRASSSANDESRFMGRGKGKKPVFVIESGSDSSISSQDSWGLQRVLDAEEGNDRLRRLNSYDFVIEKEKEFAEQAEQDGAAEVFTKNARAENDERRTYALEL